jgi:hypothetical protein
LLVHDPDPGERLCAVPGPVVAANAGDAGSDDGGGEPVKLKANPKYSEMAKLKGFIAPPGSRKKPRTSKVTIKEKDLQSMAEDLCIALGIRFFRIPDKLLGFLRVYAPEWTRVFVYQYLSGLPDLLLFRPLPGGRNEVRFIEIKTEAGKLHQSQSKWHSGLNVHVTYGWDETEAAIRNFLAAGAVSASEPQQDPVTSQLPTPFPSQGVKP